MTEFQIGLSGCGGGLESESPRHLLEMAEFADELGFAGLWINEEHFQGSLVEDEGRRCLSPVTLAAAIAARTHHLRIGFSVLLLPLHHPVRLAEEIATLDVLSGGRVDFGISRGGNERYFAAYGLESKPAAARFQDDLALIRRCWQAAPVEFGDHRLSVEPKPVQEPHPPVFIATYTEETAVWAARQGFNLICSGITNLSFAQGLIDAFAGAGGSIASVPFGRFVYVSENDASAREELWPTVIKLTDRLRSIFGRIKPHFASEADLVPETFYREMVIAGGPDSCVQQIMALRQGLGINYLNALSAFFGFLPPDLLRRSLNLLATEVMPRVRGADPASPAPASAHLSMP